MDRESVMQALKDSLRNQHCGFIENVGNVYAVSEETINDTLKLLREQEAVEPYSMNAEKTYGICPKCGKIVFRYGNVEENHYCGICGQAVKWK